jgi:membrane-associated phospholipid phosphatase
MSGTLTLSGPISRDISRRTAAIARRVSDILSPTVLGIPCLLLIVLASDVPGTYWFALLYFVVAIPLPVLYVMWLVKSGRVTDFHLPDRRDRTAPFLVTIVCGLGAVLLLFYFQAPTTFLAPVLTALSQTLLLFAITVFWQISIHAATTAGLVTFAILAMGPGASVLAVLVPLVMWARVYLGRHTLTQTVVGACLGIVSFTTLFALRGMVW